MNINPELAIRLVRDAKILGYDTETTGLDASAKVCGYVLATEDIATYIPVRHASGNIYQPDSFEKSLAKEFANRTNKTVGHNLAFDLKMSARHGVNLGKNLECTQVNEGLINDSGVGYSLEASAMRHGVTAKKGQEMYDAISEEMGVPAEKNSMAHFWKMSGDNQTVIDYSCGDGITTVELAAAQNKIIFDQGMDRVHELECRLIYYLNKMHLKGLLIDREAGAVARSRVQEALKEAYKYLPEGINVNSPRDIKKLFDDAGVTDYARTELGAPSFREKWLDHRPLGKRVLVVRRFSKLDNSFITPLLDLADENNYLHPTLNQSKSDEYGTVTGRLSCSDPNLQAFPKRNAEIGKIVRAIVVPDKGMQFGEMDFSQQEPRLFAHYSQDANLLDGYSKNLKIHNMAAKLLGLDYDTAKRLGLGMLTGLSIKGLAGHMEYSEAEAKVHHNAFMGAFPGIKKFQQDAKATAINRGFVKTLLGRRARFPDLRFAYRAVSRIIQGSGADHMKKSLLNACEYAESEGNIDILMTIHDSTVFQAEPDANVAELKRIVDNTATDMGVSLPIPTEIKMGNNWKEASYGKE